jgi:hydroxypyruvate isomerase
MTAAAPQPTPSSRKGWKLRYAPHIGLVAPDAPLFLHSAGSSDPLDQIAHLAALGFAGIEDNFLKIRPPALQERIGAALARHGMEMGCFVNNPMHWNKPLWGVASAAAHEQLDRDLDESIAAAGRSGGRITTVVSAREAETPVAYQHAIMIENLKRLAPRAEAAGLVLALETVNERRWPNMLLHHIAEAYAVVKAVDSPAVKLIFDIGHIAPMDGEVLTNLAATWDSIAAIQVADIPGRLELGTGELNWVNIFRFIRDRDYTGLIELEHLNSRPGAEGEHQMLDMLKTIDTAI